MEKPHFSQRILLAILAILINLSVAISGTAQTKTWTVTDCAEHPRKCGKNVIKTAQIDGRANGHLLVADADAYKTKVVVTVYQDSGDKAIKVVVLVNNLTNGWPTFYKHAATGSGWVETDKPAAYQEQWVKGAMASLQKQDQVFSFEGAR